MSLATPRTSFWFTGLLVALASLLSLPHLLGTEPTRGPRLAKRPAAVLLGVTPLPDSVIQQEVSSSRELQSLIPPAPEPAQPAAPEGEPQSSSLSLLAIEPQEEEAEPARPVQLLPLEEAPAPVEEALPGQPAVAQPHLTRKIVPPPAAESSSTTAPQQSAPLAMPTAPTVKYWIVSSRCCRQTSHKCGVNCRFVCHAITDDCQCLPVEFETVLGSQIPGAPTCIMVHGSFTRMDDVWEDSDCTYRWLRSGCPNVPLNFIYYTWPSEGPFAFQPHCPFSTPVPCLDFGILGRRAELNGFYLADLIGALPGPTTLSLIGHSLGSRTIASGLHLLGGGTIHGQARWNPADCGHRIRVIFAAAAIEHDWLNPGERYGCALNRAECLLNLRNECDLALSLFPLRRPFSSRALARSGFTSKDHRKLGEHNVQVSELDVAPMIGKSHGWPSYCRQPGIASVVAPWVYFEATGDTLQNAGRTDQMPRRN